MQQATVLEVRGKYLIVTDTIFKKLDCELSYLTFMQENNLEKEEPKKFKSLEEYKKRVLN